MPADLSDYTRGARLLARLKALRPGECFLVRRKDLADIVVPADPLDKQAPEYLVEWVRSRLPFACEVREHIDKGDWVFERRYAQDPSNRHSFDPATERERMRAFRASALPRWPSPCEGA